MFFCMRFPVECVRSCCLCGAGKDNMWFVLAGCFVSKLKSFFALSFRRFSILQFSASSLSGAVLALLACSARGSGVQCSVTWTLGQALCSSVVAGVQLVPRVTCSSILPPRNCTSTHVYSLQIFLKFSFDGLQQMEKHHKKKYSELRPRLHFYCLLEFTWVFIGVRSDAIWLLLACSSQARCC